ncbi:putative small secreted protein [Chitinivorax tropicus]|uniref:Putative small secreted protein n=1 Tax=Chitinivorax tropicus TaxID=714531 RepID=A0A840MP65_9PROT|nr:entericidin A/B family lipoprotein [Chitinivorax tropicus]MBB5018807.1 putative small secreted protein [Chitinivorax tropicus]
MKPILVMILAVALSAALGACNTVHGFGKDVEKVGEKISNAANK